MPELQLTEDPAEFKVRTRFNDIPVEINAMELASALIEAGASGKQDADAQDTRKIMIASVRKVGRHLPSAIDDDSCFALGARVEQEYDRLGKNTSTSQT